MKAKISFTKIKILRKGADFMMQNTVTCVILTVMSMILVNGITPTGKLSITEMMTLSDQYTESFGFCPQFDEYHALPDIPHIFTDCGLSTQVTTKMLFTDSVGAKITAGSAEMAAGIPS